MTTTKAESKNKSEKQELKSAVQTHSSASGMTSEVGTQRESSQLSKNLAVKLMSLIEDVNKDGVSAETVNASCNAAAQIYKILRLNFEMKKEGF